MNNVVIKKSKINGKGVFATKDYKKGDIVLKWHPIKLTEDEFRNLSKQKIKYTFKERGSIFLMQEPEKYVNYSCNPK